MQHPEASLTEHMLGILSQTDSIQATIARLREHLQPSPAMTGADCCGPRTRLEGVLPAANNALTALIEINDGLAAIEEMLVGRQEKQDIHRSGRADGIGDYKTHEELPGPAPRRR